MFSKEGQMRYFLSDDTWGEEELSIVHQVTDSKMYTMGKYVKEFERQFAEKMGSKYAVMSNSGSSANLLMVAALVYSGKVKRGDEVLVTSVSWSTTYFPFSQYGLKIRFVDIDKNTLNVDLKQLEAAVTEETKVVCAVNLLGNPNDFCKLCEICQEHRLILVEDNCESMGAKFQGGLTGTFGIMGTFSTYFSHHLCTVEGGMTVTDDEGLYHYMLSIRSHGWTRHIPLDSPIYQKNEDEFYESFHFIMPGYNIRPIEIEAAAGIVQLNKLDTFIRQRRKNAELFAREMRGREGYRIQLEQGESSWFGFALVLEGKNKGQRNVFVRKFAEKGIEVRPIVAGNFVRQKAVEYMDHSIYGTLKNADDIHENGFFVGNYSKPMKEEIFLLMEALEEVEKDG